MRLNDEDIDPKPLPVRPLRCPRCAGDMRLVRITPNERFPDRDDRLFECSCGEQIITVTERLD